jgi:hypothetical protein
MVFFLVVILGVVTVQFPVADMAMRYTLCAHCIRGIRIVNSPPYYVSLATANFYTQTF